MGNIIDYARTETRDFGELPFREADALVLAQLSYDDVPECVPRLDDIESRYGTLHDRVKQFDPRHPIRSVRMLRKPPFDGVTIARADDELHHGSAVPDHNVENVGLVDPQVTHDFYHAIAANPRFSGIEMGAFLEQFDGDEQTQFAAVTYRLPSGMLVVAFRGTDDSLVGWKEDFNMAFQYPVPAQVTAADYLARVAELWKDVPIVLTGHSKGGNLAVYAAANVPSEIQERITVVYSHDGPGFDEAFFDEDGYVRIASKIHKSVPGSSIIGMLFETREHVEDGYTVVSSDGASIMQHFALHWQVDHGQFVQADGLTSSAQYLARTINGWMAKYDDEHRRKFIENLFAIFEAGGYDTFGDLTSHLTQSLPIMLAAARNIDVEDRDVMIEVLKGFAATAAASVILAK